MLDKLMHEVLFGKCKQVPGARIIAGFSGGADSLCLLHLFKQQQVQVIAAHFNHHLRPEADAEAAVCRETAESWGVPFIEGTGDVQGFSAEHKLSIEETSRILRYRFLFATAKTQAASAVAVAHHADDQVETILMHLLRGAGSNGLTGMKYLSADPLGESDIPLIRPLLGIWRSEIQQYCVEHHLTPLEDTTNFDPTYFRNRIRLELIPQLETYNSEFKKHLWQTASIVADENQYLESETEKVLAQTLVRAGDQWALLDVAALHDQPLWLVRRLVRKIIFSLKSSLRDVAFAEVERAVEFIRQPDYGTTCQVTDNLEIVKYDQACVLFASKNMLLNDLWPQLEPSPETIPLDAGMATLSGGWELTVTRLEEIPKTAVTDNPWEALLDEAKIRDPLSVGTRRNGELFIPFGMQGRPLKVGDFFTNEHLPMRARAAWPLVRSGERIVWVPGFRIAEFCRITPATRSVLKLELTQEKKEPA